MRIGPCSLTSNLVLAPMAGVTDRPFRQLCRNLGAGLAVSEMLTANPQTRLSRKTLLRSNHVGETAPRAVQIAGADPRLMADAARYNEARGAQIIDINMGCPAKKVCRTAAGSALLRDEPLVARILEAVVGAVQVPVTLKLRTGWDPDHRNASTVARVAEQSGVQALAIHGRTRACGFGGNAEYDTIAAIKRAVSIPVIANGDIDGPARARRVLELTRADGLMIGRAAQGRPWIFREVDHFLATGTRLPPPTRTEFRRVATDHIERIYDFYGAYLGVRIARKHITWYCQTSACWPHFRPTLYAAESITQQRRLTNNLFEEMEMEQEKAA